MPLPTHRSHDDLRTALETWFSATLGTPATVGDISVPEGTGMSSETLLFDLHHGDTVESLVARIRPDMSDWPVFPVYDMDCQARTMQLIARHSDLPVPDVKFMEPDESVLGAPFIVMGRVEGRALADIPPYTFGGSFLDELDAGERREFQRNFLSVQAQIHGIDLTGVDTSFIAPDDGGDALGRQIDAQQAYFEWAREGREIPLIDRGLAWLREHQPADPGSTVLNWGDARPGNILVDGITPTAVLDWEMVDLGPAAVDVGYAIFMHSFFQHISGVFELPGFPDMFRRDDVIADYEAAGGAALPDIDWFVTFASVRFAIVSVRTSSREAAYGNREVPDDPEDLLMNKAILEQQLA